MNVTSFPSNLSTADSSSGSQVFLHRFVIPLYSVICVLGVTGNGMVIYFTGFKMKKTVNTVWFLNLSVADFLFTFFLVFSIISMSQNFDWPFGDFMCKFVSLITVLNMFASIFLLTAISLDRCLSTWVVTWVQNKRTLFKARISCFFTWFVSCICSLPFCIYRQTQFNPTLQTTYCIQNYPRELSTYKSLTVFRFVVGFLIPLFIISTSYVAIGIRARRLTRHQKKLKSIKIILAVILTFFFCWLPFHIHVFMDIWLRETKARNKNADLDGFKEWLDFVGHLVRSLAFLNSCLNPFLYVFLCDEFQKKLKQSLALVFESAFAEEHLALLVSHSSFKQHQSRNPGTSTGTENAQSQTFNFSN